MKFDNIQNYSEYFTKCLARNELQKKSEKEKKFDLLNKFRQQYRVNIFLLKYRETVYNRHQITKMIKALNLRSNLIFFKSIDKAEKKRSGSDIKYLNIGYSLFDIGYSNFFIFNIPTRLKLKGILKMDSHEDTLSKVNP